jgi:hypothetical protein
LYANRALNGQDMSRGDRLESQGFEAHNLQ